MFYVYIIKSKEKGFYIGYTSDVRRRFKEHSAKRSCELLYYEAYRAAKQARNRERKLKHYGNAWQALQKRIED